VRSSEDGSSLRPGESVFRGHLKTAYRQSKTKAMLFVSELQMLVLSLGLKTMWHYAEACPTWSELEAQAELEGSGVGCACYLTEIGCADCCRHSEI
jgi:hypothetical protein